MKRLSLFFVLAMLCSLLAHAQIKLPDTWKFNTGDNPQWSSPDFNDAGWQTIRVGSPWEIQGHDNYDGFAWYRTKVVIPSSLKTQSFLKGDFKLSLGKIDDGDQVFLNGKLIGQNAEAGGSIEEGNWDATRMYRLPLNDPAIHWDQENVIAVRVFDHSGNGGMFEGPYTASVADITDAVMIDDRSTDFHFTNRTHLQKELILKTTNTQYDLSGKLTIHIINPIDRETIWEKTVAAHFSNGKPFSYVYAFILPSDQSYQAEYIFTEARSRKAVTVSQGLPYLLTPAESPKPQINGASVAGVHPGHPFLYHIAATGKRPLQFAASSLPEGLHLDSKTGIISGVVNQKGNYKVTLKATNALGSTSSLFTIEVGDQIGLTPAMGWNSWNAWGLSVNESKVKAAADAMVKKGLVNHGWTYINIDDGWERETRAADGEIVTNNKFPDMKRLADYVHSQGLKIGIYSSPGPRTCGGFLGSYQHEAQDAHTYAKWGIDYLKYDWCSYSQIAPNNPNLSWLQKPYKLMDSALQTLNRDIYFSLCQYGMGDVWKWGAQVGGNSWRTTGDINDSWKSMAGIGFNQGNAAPYSQPGHWNDPDMLVVGKVGWGPNLHNSHLSPDEQYTHISLWCMLSAPLLIGCDMSNLDDFTLNLLTNDEVIAIDQDPLGKEAIQVAESDSVKIYAKTLADGSKAVGLFNVGSQSANIRLSFPILGLNGKQEIRDVWRQKELGTFTGSYDAQNIPAHGVLLVRVSSAK